MVDLFAVKTAGPSSDMQDCIVGHVPVKAAVADSLIAKSGVGHLFARDADFQADTVAVSWVKRNTQESDLAYLARVRSMHEMTSPAKRIAVSASGSLGLRCSKPESPSTWRVVGLTADSGSDDLATFLTKMGWTRVEVMSRFHRKGIVTWQVRDASADCGKPCS